MTWRTSRVSPDGTHHTDGDGAPLYAARFDEVLPFHPPGLAPVRGGEEAWHIQPDGGAAYAPRYRRTFGFYEDRAAVDTGAGWTHIRPDGTPVTDRRWVWCGNLQQGRAPVRDDAGRYTHVDAAGNPVYPARWRYAGDFREGQAVVHADDGRATHVDYDGRPSHGVWWLDLDVFHKGFARARGPDGWTHIGRDGRPAHGRWFAEAEPFYNGQARCRTLEGRPIIVDEGGRELVSLGDPPSPAPLHAVSGVLTAYWASSAAAAAVDLCVFDALPGGTASVAARGGLSVDATGRLLRACQQLGLVRRTAEGWAPTEAGALLRTGAGMDAAARVWSRDHEAAWAALVPALQGAGPAGRGRTGMSYFDRLGAAERRGYHRAMRAYAEDDYAAVATAVPWHRHRRLIDAGGGDGALAQQVAHAFPHLQVDLLDLPEVVGLTDAGDPPNLRRVGCDLFAAWPVRADAIVLARVLHDWPDAEALRLLDGALAALAPGGAIYVLEMVLGETDGDGGLLDLNMLVTTGGRERTEADWRRLSAEAGLRLTHLVPLRPWVTVLTLERG